MIATEEQTLIRDMAREFAKEKLKPFSAEWDRDSFFPRDTLKEMGELGFLGMLIPEEWGGPGTSYVSYSMALEELAVGDASVTTVISVQMLVNNIIHQQGTTEQKEQWLKPLAQGQAISAFGLTEPHAGSDASNLKTRAVRDGDDWIINGSKQFITNGSYADVILLFAVTTPEQGSKGISAFLIPADTPGFQCARKEEKMGQKASDSTFLTFDDVRVPTSALVGKENEGYKYALQNLEAGRIGIASQSLGMARAAYEAALEYSKERETFGKPISEHQAVAFRLADMATQIEAARQLTWHAAGLRDQGLPCLKEAAMAKLFATEMVEKVCYDAIQTHGGYGYIKDYGVEQIYRDARITTIYEGTSDIQRMLISRQILKD
ncbi:MAG: acyl-CoA dehydrogenase family protein [Rhodospirillales bacterium]|nr:acyl-CoA dehydrogenase family protein [Rhodospirillales bacterium]